MTVTSSFFNELMSVIWQFDDRHVISRFDDRHAIVVWHFDDRQAMMTTSAKIYAVFTHTGMKKYASRHAPHCATSIMLWQFNYIVHELLIDLNGDLAELAAVSELCKYDDSTLRLCKFRIRQL